MNLVPEKEESLQGRGVRVQLFDLRQKQRHLATCIAMHGISGDKSFGFQREIELVISIFRAKKGKRISSNRSQKMV